MWKVIKRIFKKREEIEMPYVRAIIRYTDEAIENGIEDDLNKVIQTYYGDELHKEEPYSKSRVKTLTEVEHIPIYDITKENKFEEGEEIDISEVKYESI